MQIELLIPFSGIIALMFAIFLSLRIMREKPGNELMQEISNMIEHGAMAFLKREYSVLVFFIIIVSLILGWVRNPITSLSFLIGAICSGLAGLTGMKIATKANSRTANAAIDGGITKAFKIAFSGGAVMGMSVAGFGLLGLGILYYFIRDPEIINGFALGAIKAAIWIAGKKGLYSFQDFIKA